MANSGPDGHIFNSRVCLPLELRRTILYCVEQRSTLLKLLLVSREFHEEAIRLLYREFDSYLYATDTATQLKFFERVSADALVARLVRRFTLHIFEPLMAAGHRYYAILSNALRSMTELQSLTFHNPCFEAYDHITVGCSFQLTELHWWTGVGGGTDFVTFLSGQLRLRKFKFECFAARNVWAPDPRSSGVHISPTAMPNLVQLQARFAGLCDLLPGRHVTHVQLHPNRRDRLEGFHMAIDTIGPSFRHVRSLRWGNYGFDDPLPFQPLLPFLNNLEDLQLFRLKTGDAIDIVQNLKSLRRLCFPPNVIDAAMSMSSWEMEVQRVPALFEACATLTDVLAYAPGEHASAFVAVSVYAKEIPARDSPDLDALVYWHWRRETGLSHTEHICEEDTFDWP